jgi:quercetin dioxygenase-like cupin family protein
MPEEPHGYQSYLLRLWRSSSHGNPVWRASLESAQTGERRGFADLASLFTFLKEQTEDDSSHDTPKGGAARPGCSSSASAKGKPPMKYVRIYADPSGESHFEDVEVAFSPIDAVPPVPPILVSPFTPAAQLAFVHCLPGGGGDWQTAPRRQFLFLLAGENETEVSDGEVRHFGPGSIVLLEDTAGKGHNGRFVGTDDILLVLVELPGE